MKPMLMVVNFILVLAALAASPAYGQTELYKQTLFVYDDSWQSKVEWDDCTFCIPRSTVRWRALRHEMTLVVNGPNNQYVQNAVNACMQEAAGAGLVAGLVAGSTRGALPCRPLGEHSRPTFLAASHTRARGQSPSRSLIAPTGQTGPDRLSNF
jgi:hypothetical protein